MKVLFRKWRKGGDIDAVFPELPGTNNPSTCISYSHIGQHSSCDALYYYGKTVPAKQEEYADLLAELTRIGYADLVVVKRQTRKDYMERKTEIDRVTKFGKAVQSD